MKLFLLLAPLFLTKEIEEELCSVSSLQITKDDDKVTSTFDNDTTFTLKVPTFTDDVDRRQGIKSCFKTSTSTSTNTQANYYKNSSHKDSDDELFYAIFTFLMFLL